jgi:hypothetical protein
VRVHWQNTKGEQLTGVVIKGAEVVVKGQTLVKGWVRGLRRHWRVRWAYGGEAGCRQSGNERDGGQTSVGVWKDAVRDC